MLNQIALVGRIVKNPEVSETGNGKKFCLITLAVSRIYKNSDGEYETDFINCRLWGDTAENTAKYCQKGDLVGVKGRLQSGSYENEKGTQFYTEVVAERVTFLSAKKENEPKEENKNEIAL